MNHSKKKQVMKIEVPTLVKWAGGKKQLLSQLVPLFPKKIKRYFEPFAGGGAVALYLLKHAGIKYAQLSDVNDELISTYEVVRDSKDQLISLLRNHSKKHNAQFYYQLREADIKKMSKLEQAARFIYLNKTCFNGLHRVNLKGKFNVPIGSYKNPTICNEQDIKEISKLLKTATFQVCSFEKAVAKAKKGDFIYFDPPYYPLKKTSFTTYAKNSFLDDEQKKLAHTFKELDIRGCYVMLSNSNTQFIKDLYKDYNVLFVSARRMINSDAANRGPINEVVITNYPTSVQTKL